MKKEDFIMAIAQKTESTKSVAEEALTAFIETLSEVFSAQDTFILPGIGSFGVKQRAARTGRNPATGQAIQIPAAVVPYFKPSSKLKELLNQKTSKDKSKKEKL